MKCRTALEIVICDQQPGSEFEQNRAHEHVNECSQEACQIASKVLHGTINTIVGQKEIRELMN